MISLYENFWTQEEQARIIAFIDSLSMKTAQPWLGRFRIKGYYDNSIKQTELSDIFDKFCTLNQDVYVQDFNTVFLQKYPEGSYVNEHKDPKNNVGYTLIGIFGDFEGAETDVEGNKVRVEPGQILAMPCTIDGVKGPKHSVKY